MTGEKDMTRRIITQSIEPLTQKQLNDIASWGYIKRELTPPWNPGDILYVKEPYWAYGYWKIIPGHFTSTFRQKRKFIDQTGPETFTRIYYSDDPPVGKSQTRDLVGWHKRTSRFMPKKYARTFLEVLEVRAQQLKSITDEDAIREGIERSIISANAVTGAVYRDYEYGFTGDNWRTSPKKSFLSLFQLIHGAEVVDKNPWVWVNIFKRVDKPNNFLA